jgi:predicted flap endonuclease-1-like 5' DNA nuclease
VTYLLWQLFACVLGTAILFLSLGWFLRGQYWSIPTGNPVTGAERTSWQTSLDGIKARLEAEAARRVAAEKAFDDAQSQSAKISSLLDRHTVEIRNLAEELAEKYRELAGRDNLLANLQADATRMAAELAGISEENNKLIAQLNEANPKLAMAATASAEVAALRARVGELEPQLAGRETRLLAITDELAALKQRWLEREGKFHSINEENTVLKMQLAEYQLKPQQAVEQDGDLTNLRGRIAELEPLIAQQEAQIGTWETRYAAAVAEKDAELSECRGRVAKLAGQLSSRNAATPVQQMLPTHDHDDLKKIYGIGPVLEKRLNDLGIYFFREIAMWTKEDILRYEGQLKEFRDRIVRDNWVEGAREEHFKKYGETLLKAQSAAAQ